MSLLTPDDLAAVLGVKRAKVMEWNRTFHWPHVRVGRTIRWTPEQVDEITRRHSVKPDGQIARSDGRTQRSANRRRSA